MVLWKKYFFPNNISVLVLDRFGKIQGGMVQYDIIWGEVCEKIVVRAVREKAAAAAARAEAADTTRGGEKRIAAGKRGQGEDGRGQEGGKGRENKQRRSSSKRSRRSCNNRTRHRGLLGGGSAQIRKKNTWMCRGVRDAHE